jgi:enolase
MLTKSIEKAGYKQGEIMISLDIAASEFGRGGVYRPGLEGRSYSREEWIEVLLAWLNNYPILSIEDPLAEDDTEGMIAFTQAVGGKVQVIGDDYLVTNAARVSKASEQKACNAVLIKPNQAGTMTETLAALKAAKACGFSTVVSARSGESEDVMISHLSVGWNAGQLKVGSFARSERMAKWNELLRIEESLGTAARYAGRSALPI